MSCVCTIVFFDRCFRFVKFDIYSTFINFAIHMGDIIRPG